MATEEDDDLGDAAAPPEADAVALRALASAGLLRRLELERRKASATEQAALRDWLDENGLFANFGPEGFALFGARPGAWSQEDHASVAWAAEELAMLGWALGQCEFPPLFERARAEPLLALFPSTGPVGPFSLAAKLKPLETIETQLALCQTLAVAAQTEAWARAIAEDPSLIDGDEDLEALLTAAEAEGFPRAQVSSERGATAAAVEGVRHTARALVEGLFASGSPHRAVAFPPEALAGLDDEALALFLATSDLRAQALTWLLEGDAWEED